MNGEFHWGSRDNKTVSFGASNFKQAIKNREGGGGRRLDLGGGDVLVVLFYKRLPQLWEIFLFIREMNEPVVILDKAFSDYLFIT